MKNILLLLLISGYCFGQNKDSLIFENTKLSLKERIIVGLTLASNLSKNNDSLANYYVNKLTSMLSQTNDKDLTARIYYIRGVHEIMFDRLDFAIVDLQKAEKLFTEYDKNHSYLPSVYSAFGQLYLKDAKPKKAIDYLEKSIVMTKKQSKIDTLDLMQAYYTIGTNYTTLNEWKKSVQYYRTAYNLAQKTTNSYAIGATSSGLAIALKDMGVQYDKKYLSESITLSEKANTIFKGMKLDANTAYCYSTIGLCYRYLGDFKKAIANHQLAIKLSEKFQIKTLLSDEYEYISQTYAATNDMKNAHYFLSKHIEINNELKDEDRAKTIDELSTKYETEKKEAKIKVLAQQNQIATLESNRKNVLIYSILGGILALATIAYFSFTRFKAKKENELLSSQLEDTERRLEIEKKATESELKALKSQMNPHFMFNALNSIQEQFMYGDKVKANEQMSNFTYLTRQILTVSGKKKINLSTEVEILEKYLELEKMRFDKGFEYNITLGQTIDEDYHQIPPMLIQPFVENSIKHGLLHKQGNKYVNIHFELDQAEEHIICTVEDNGIGREKSAEIKLKSPQKHQSFSTSATEERLQLLGLQTEKAIVYEDLFDQNNVFCGTKVSLKITL